MNRKNVSGSARFKTTGLVAALVLASALMLQPKDARAQWAVIDVPTEINTLTQQIEAASAYYEQAARWKATWDHYYQQIAHFMSQVHNPTLSNTVSFDYVSMDFGVQEKCGGAGGFSFSLSSLSSTLVPDFQGNIMDNQKKICAQIQMLQNQKYNATVRYLKEVAPTLKQDLQNINAQRQANNEQGTLAAITEASTRLQNQQTTSGQDLDNQVASCDRLISTLTEMQRNLARQALKGKPAPIIGDLVKTATLEAALKAK
ncbi:hypothetical protein [Cognatilysobacter lacus]|uniref:Uncharacterized protein n=1 Tax=Cognatilysobacter lacus TaxID=1643323 RepID=A0A5D8ZFM5_9GAMM|nr:hypothetical protein [Lysobacter lacus]TZF91484.1 hypothetical protein FW784_01525 [Lysobacter lacus]